jgi:opacity protein-like surface antigen
VGIGRATIHIPGAEVFVFWADLTLGTFASETLETTLSIAGGPTLPAQQTTTETMVAMHAGLQLASPTQRGFFRPRASIGIGPYFFDNTVFWSYDLGDTTVTLDSEKLDSQVRFGWRGTLGVDFFVTPKYGITADFVYDHVFNLNQREGSFGVDQNARFQGFTVGFIYMFTVPQKKE